MRTSASLAVAIAVALIASLASCSRSAPPQAAPPAPDDPASALPVLSALPPSPVAPTLAPPLDDEPRGEGGACGALLDRFTEARRAGSGACKVDVDCATFAGGLDREAKCGGVTDRATATKLSAIEAEWRKRGCRYEWNCGAQSFEPACEAGTCVSRPRYRPKVGLAPSASACDARG